MDFSAPFVASTESPGWPAISRATDCSINSPRVLLISNTTWANRLVATDSENVARNGEDRIAHRYSNGPPVTYDSCNPPANNLAPSIFHRISDTPRVRRIRRTRRALLVPYQCASPLHGNASNLHLHMHFAAARARPGCSLQFRRASMPP